MEKQQDIVQTCIVHSCNEIEAASTFAMSEHFQYKWQPTMMFFTKIRSVSLSCISLFGLLKAVMAQVAKVLFF